MEVAEGTSEEGISPAGTSAEACASGVGVPSRVGTSIRASIGNSVDSGAAPYSASAALFLVSTLVTVSVMVTRDTTLPGIARSILTVMTLLWAATIRILARRANGGFVAEPPHLCYDAAVVEWRADSWVVAEPVK